MNKGKYLQLQVIKESSKGLLSIIEDKNIYKARKQIGLFIKFTPNQYVEYFIKGKLHLKNIKYFNKIEEHENFQTRKDELEGVAASFDSRNATLAMNGIPLNIYGRMNLHHSSSNNINIFCMTAIPISLLQFSQEKLIFSEKFREFGDKAIIIKPEFTTLFMNKIQKALHRRKNYYACPGEPYTYTHVDYEEENYSGRMGVFRKLKTFEWQSEWRIAIYRDIKRYNPIPITLSIGNIENICFTVDTIDLIKNGIDLIPS